MMKHIKAIVLALSVAAFSLAGVAYADDAKLPEPAAPAKATLEDGKINVYLGTPRVSGYAIGDSIPVTIVFELTPDKSGKPADLTPPKPEAAPAPSVPQMSPYQPTPSDAPPKVEKAPAPTPLAVPLIDVEGLKMQVQYSEALDVEMLTPATEVTRYTRDGKEYLKVVYYVWTFTTTKQSQVDVKADFTYAVTKLEDGSPNWMKGTTPTISIGTRKTATDNQVTLLEGDLKLKASPIAPAAYIFLIVGPLLMLPLFGALALTGYKRYMAPKKLSVNEEFWAAIDPVVADATANGGFQIEHYKRIFFMLRRRFGVNALDGYELINALKSHADLAGIEFSAVEQVFGMEAVFYAKAASVTEEQQKSFIEGIGKLVPRH
jgi:hypothetical protein